VSVAIFVTDGSIVDFFFSTGISYEVVMGPIALPIWSCPDIDNLLNELGVASDRYHILDLYASIPSNNNDYSWVSVKFLNGEDVVMVKLAFEQTGKSAQSVIEKLKQLDSKVTTQ
jgi:hypothetical protein